jgi:hypothetical protein
MPERFRADDTGGTRPSGSCPGRAGPIDADDAGNLNVYLREKVARPKRFELLAF